MALLSLHNLTRGFGARTLFAGLHLELQPGRKVGVIGANGSGKSTLLRTAGGLEEPDGGAVIRAASAAVGFLHQDVAFPPGSTVFAAAMEAFSGLRAIEAEMRALEADMAGSGGAAADRLARYGELQERFERAGGYTAEARAREVLTGLGFPPGRQGEPAGVLSGGERVRLALARLLLEAPDVLLLDEPTNHLDLPALSWLEDHLSRSGAAALLVSHDRYFLDAVTDATLEMGPRPRLYPGNFSQYLRLRGEDQVADIEAYRRAQAALPQVREVIAAYQKAWTTPPKRWTKRLAELEAVPPPQVASRSIRPRASAPDGDRGEGRGGPSGRAQARQGAAGGAGGRGSRGVALELAAVSKAFAAAGDLYGRDGFSARVLRGERVGLVGPNGSGKSTLLRMLLGEVEPDGGAFGWAEGLRVGWLPQSLDGLDPKLTLVEQLTSVPGVGQREARSALADFLFYGDAVFARTGECSGGERTRVALCRLLLQPWDALLLDEPTNHLDMESRRAVEGALEAYAGTVLVASHDRFFLDRVCERLWVFGEGRRGRDGGRPAGREAGSGREAAAGAGSPGVVDFPGNYSAWAAAVAAGGETGREVAGDDGPAGLAAAIRNAERRAEALQARLSHASTFEGGSGRRLAEEWKAVQAELADLHRRWQGAARGAGAGQARGGPARGRDRQGP